MVVALSKCPGVEYMWCATHILFIHMGILYSSMGLSSVWEVVEFLQCVLASNLRAEAREASLHREAKGNAAYCKKK